MKKKQQYALNKLFCFGIVFGSFLACVAYGFFVTNELVLGIVFALLAFAFLCVLPVFTPFVYSFDEDGVTLRYLFFPNERYLWKNVRAIVVEDKTHSSRTSLLVEFFFANVFCINGRTVGEQRFYMKGHVRKSFRTKHLFKKHWDGTITGYLFEDWIKWFKKRKKKKQKEIEQHFTDEIAPMEREVRAQSREYIAPFIDRAKEQGLDFRVKYLYITKDLEEHKSRPEEGYIYTLMAEISRFGETDESRIVVFSTDLVHVRLGKRYYRGVKCESAEEEFTFMAADVLDEIKKNGIEAYCGGEY